MAIGYLSRTMYMSRSVDPGGRKGQLTCVVEWSEYDEIPGIHGWNPWCMETGWLVNEAACR